MDEFRPENFEEFGVVSWDYDDRRRTIHMRYSLHDLKFEEKIEFVTACPTSVPADRVSFERAVTHLHIAAGVSYYKAAAPKLVNVQSASLTAEEQMFHHLLYDQGLREFAARNGLGVPRDVAITSKNEDFSPNQRRASGRTGYGLVVPIGGGKDSMVLAEALVPLFPRLLAVNPRRFMFKLADQSGLSLIEIKRTIDPKLLTLNAMGALNGHVPITAIISLITVVAGYIYGYNQVAMAIERSASEETTVIDGVPVNHQFSKSFEFESALRRLISYSIDSDFQYGAALRPYAELAISRAFSKMKQYHSTFRSCNSVFSSRKDNNEQWCGNCPKCRFVALTLAPFMSLKDVSAIVGRDMFNDASQVDGFASLMSADKPYECVGERRESAIALRMLAEQDSWRDTVVVKALASSALQLATDQDIKTLWQSDNSKEFDDSTVAGLVRLIVEPN